MKLNKRQHVIYDIFASEYYMVTSQENYDMNYDTYTELENQNIEELKLEIYPYSEVLYSYRIIR